MVFGVGGELPVEGSEEIGKGGVKLWVVGVDVGEGDFDFAG